jgi:hypothetical protein
MARASSRIRDEVGDRHRGGESLVRWNLVDGAQVRIALRRRDVAMAHDLLSNRLGFPELGEQRRGGMAQRVEGHPVALATVGDSCAFRRFLESPANRLDGSLPVFDDVAVRPEPGI